MLDEFDSNQEMMTYLPLIEKVVQNIKIKSVEYSQEDLINTGFIGLMDAFEKFDSSKNVPFEKYAYMRIKGTIIDEIRKNSLIPRSQMDRLKLYYKVNEELEQKLKRTPTEDEVCQELDISKQQLKDIYHAIHMLAKVSLNEVLFDDETSGLTRMEAIKDKRAVDANEKLMEKEREKHLHQAIKQLDKREQTILQLYYEEELTLKEIAHILDLSTPRISQIHGKILADLKINIKLLMQEED